MDKNLPIKRIHHLEFIVGNALQAAYFYRKTFGFNQIGYRGPETGHPDCASYVLEQGRIRFIFTTPLSYKDPRNIFLLLHGDSVKDICFEVDDVDETYHEAVRRGAVSSRIPNDLQDETGSVRVAAVRTFGDVIHTFVSTDSYKGLFLPGYQPARIEGQELGFTRIDHVVANAEDRDVDRDWAVECIVDGRHYAGV